MIVPLTVTAESARTVALSGSELRVTTGACVSRITVRVESVRFPAASTARNASVFGPSVVNGTLAVKLVCPAVPGVTEAGWPFTVMVTAVCSTTMPTASTVLCRVMKPGTGAVMVSCGARESVAMPQRVNREPGVPFISTWSVFVARNVTGLRKPATCWFKSETPMISVPFRMTRELELRREPSSSPFRMFALLRAS